MRFHKRKVAIYKCFDGIIVWKRLFQLLIDHVILLKTFFNAVTLSSNHNAETLRKVQVKTRGAGEVDKCSSSSKGKGDLGVFKGEGVGLYFVC